MIKLKVILLVVLILSLAPVLLILMLKLYERLLNALISKIEKKNFYIRPTENKTASRIGKYLIEIVVGLTIFVICLRVFSLPIYFLQETDWIPPLLIQLLLIIFPLFYAVMFTYKTVRFIHRHLELNENG